MNQKQYVFGGSFVHYREIFLGKLIEKLKEGNKLYNKDNIAEIITAELENDAGIIGATII